MCLRVSCHLPNATCHSWEEQFLDSVSPDPGALSEHSGQDHFPGGQVGSRTTELRICLWTGDPLREDMVGTISCLSHRGKHTHHPGCPVFLFLRPERTRALGEKLHQHTHSKLPERQTQCVEGEAVFPGGITGGSGRTQKSPGLSPTCRHFWDPTALQDDSLLEKKSLPESGGGEK